MKANAAYIAWYNLGYWFHKPGYYYRNVNEKSGVYCADGTYPGCERGCIGQSLEKLISQGYKPISVKDLVMKSGFLPNEWSLPLNDGSVDFNKLWDYILNSLPHDTRAGLSNPMKNSKVCREYYESK